MAKRKRLTPSITQYQPDPAAPVSKPAMRAPIADVAAEASAVAALDALSSSMQTARAAGRMVIDVPLGDIVSDFLVRDRLVADTDEMAALMASITARGQQTPIEVVDLKEGRFGLISGWRRCQALQRLQEQTGDARYGTVLALVRQPADQADSYLAMVDENEIRIGLSYYERARIAVKAAAQGAFEDEDQALKRLYASASRAKRSKVRSFVSVYHALDTILRYPEAIGERLGLQLAQCIQSNPKHAAALSDALEGADVGGPEQEAAVLKEALKDLLEPNKPKSKASEKGKSIPTFQTRRLRAGVVARVFDNGRIEIEGEALSAEVQDGLLAWLDRTLG